MAYLLGNGLISMALLMAEQHHSKCCIC